MNKIGDNQSQTQLIWKEMAEKKKLLKNKRKILKQHFCFWRLSNFIELASALQLVRSDMEWNKCRISKWAFISRNFSTISNFWSLENVFLSWQFLTADSYPSLFSYACTSKLPEVTHSKNIPNTVYYLKFALKTCFLLVDFHGVNDGSITVWIILDTSSAALNGLTSVVNIEKNPNHSSSRICIFFNLIEWH